MNLTDAALRVLQTADPNEKADLTHNLAKQWYASNIKNIEFQDVPDRPSRPDRPLLKAPTDMPKRKKAGSVRGRIALLHALAHIELNAIDLAWDIIARFSGYYNADQGFGLPLRFYEQWLDVAVDEAKHFKMLQTRLNDFDASYGDLPAHDGLWESALETKNDFAARLAIVPMVLEARGLDVTPQMIEMMYKHGDIETAKLLQVIHDDEISHVEAGTVWFDIWCNYHRIDGQKHWQDLVTRYFKGRLKRPFNHDSRGQAGMIRDWYEPLADIAAEIA